MVWCASSIPPAASCPHTLEEARLHPAIRASRRQPATPTSSTTSGGGTVESGAGRRPGAAIPQVRARAQDAEGGRHRLTTTSSYGSYLSGWRRARRAQDVERLADLPDGVRQGHPDRRRRPDLRSMVSGGELKRHARRMTPPATPPSSRVGQAAAPPGRPCPAGRSIGTASRSRAGGDACGRGEAAAPTAMSAGIRNSVMCGALPVPLDPAHRRAAAPSSSATSSFRRWRATSSATRCSCSPAAPGRARSSVAAMTMPLFARLNNRRDIVFVDQRGTGSSAPLDVPGPGARNARRAVRSPIAQLTPARCVQGGSC